MPTLPPALTSRFGGVPVAAATLQRLLAGGVRKALPIQAAAMPRLLLRESLAIHAQTGSGKTLAYLLPLMARLVPDEPRQVLVVVPSSQLAHQIVRVARQLAPPGVGVGLLQRATVATQPETVLITTGKDLGGLLPILLRDERRLQHQLRSTLQAIVLDEPDAIFAPPEHRRCEGAPPSGPVHTPCLWPAAQLGAAVSPWRVARGSMRNRAKRNKWLMRQPHTHALQLLLERQRTARTARLQLVLASATLSKLTMCAPADAGLQP